MSVHSRHPQFVEDQRQFFDELITEEWDSYTSEAWDFSRRFEVSRLLRTLRPAHVLNVGCGCGFHDVEFAEREYVERVDAIDYSAASIRKADEAYPHPKVFRRVADLATEVPEAVHDLVVSFQVLEHLTDADAYFRYVVAACRPGGAIAVVTPNGDRLDNRIRRWRGEPAVMLDPQHFHEYTRAELVTLGRRHGLVLRDAFAHGLQSLIYPRLTPRDHRRVTTWGAAVPAIASVIGVVFDLPRQRS